VIDVAKRQVVRTISVSGQKDALQVTILFARDEKRLYVAETGRNDIAEVDVRAGKVLRRLAAGTNGDGLAIAP
jgi:DNA-binding beta-propeller fold protein YncE